MLITTMSSAGQLQKIRESQGFGRGLLYTWTCLYFSQSTSILCDHIDPRKPFPGHIHSVGRSSGSGSVVLRKVYRKGVQKSMIPIRIMTPKYKCDHRMSLDRFSGVYLGSKLLSGAIVGVYWGLIWLTLAFCGT